MEALAVSDEGQLVGFAFVHIAADGSGTFAVAIIARHRRRGLGAAAFRALARYLRDAGAERLAVDVSWANAGSRHAAERAGLAVVGCDDGFSTYGFADAA